MTKVLPAPIYEPLIEDPQNAVPSLPWILFFNGLFNGDTGTTWTPTFSGLTTVGTPTITGTYYKIGQSLCYFSIKITPATSTTATAGTTFVNNFPLDVKTDGICFAVSGLLGSNSGAVDAATNGIYVPSWSAVTVPLTVVGLAEI